ncbi:MAG: hypothetical protein KC613_03985, partial [Myxococcales bacterium]|nr:hypothetical protein [Myxococcales bacterium]
AGMEGGPGEIYHLGVEEEVSIRDLILGLGEALGVTLNLVPGELRAGGTNRRCPAIGKLRGLGYTPQVSLKDGLAKSARWYA